MNLNIFNRDFVNYEGPERQRLNIQKDSQTKYNWLSWKNIYLAHKNRLCSLKLLKSYTNIDKILKKVKYFINQKKHIFCL